MPKSQPSGFKPIEVEVGVTSPPIVREVVFQEPVPVPESKPAKSAPKPQDAADKKEKS